METLLSFALAVLLALALPLGFIAAPRENRVWEETLTAVETSAPAESPSRVPETKRIEETIECRVKNVYNGHIIVVYRKVELCVRITADTVLEGSFTVNSKLRIAHSGAILMADPPEITADRIEVLSYKG